MIFDIAAGGIVVGICALMLKEIGAKGVPVLISIAFCILLSASFLKISDIFSEFFDMGIFDLAPQLLHTAVKLVGAGYLFGISADICRTLGVETVAKGVEIGGRVEIMIIVFPYFKEIIELLPELFI